MAERCSLNASSFQIPHLTKTIPWSIAPFPSKPKEGQPFELIARNARLHTLFEAMKQVHAPVVAFGHHADDQVETALMRLARGSGELGAAGMRRVRRWGMGVNHPGDLLYLGYDGLSRWIIRPFLDISKDRILATCAENNLEYVTDPTNFEPSSTLRNAIRHRLSQQEKGTEVNSIEELPPDIRQKMQAMDHAIETLESVSSVLDITAGQERLRIGVRQLTSRVEDIDNQVDSLVKRHRLPSPAGTFFVPAQSATSSEVNTEPTSKRTAPITSDRAVRTAFILRILRYVSFQPWGSKAADGKRRYDGLSLIINRVLAPPPDDASKLRPFAAGGGVLWTPIRTPVKRPNGLSCLHSKPQTRQDTSPKVLVGWLASRQPPYHREPSPSLNVTERLVRALQTGRSSEKVLFDNRFLMQFDLTQIPGAVSKSLLTKSDDVSLEVTFATNWFLPRVVWIQKKEDDLVETEQPVAMSPGSSSNVEEWVQGVGKQVTRELDERRVIDLKTMMRQRLRQAKWRERKTRLGFKVTNEEESGQHSWVSAEWIRPLSAL